MNTAAPDHEPSHGQHTIGQLRRGRLMASRLYVCTDLQRFITAPDAGPVDELDFDALQAFFEAAYSGGVDIIQVRDKHVAVQTEIAALNLLRQIADSHGCLSAANDRADVAAVTGVDVFHIGQEDLTADQARQVLGEDVIIGLSCRTPEQVDDAAADPALDYFCAGPVWETPTKPGRAAVGLELPRHAAQLESSKPFFAIGGIDATTIDEVSASGAYRVVVVRAVTRAEDPHQASAALRERLPA